jgi:hypothetical protein
MNNYRGQIGFQFKRLRSKDLAFRVNSVTPRYVLMTAAHNEEALLNLTIASVLSQTVLPALWVIVSDRSTDATDDIIRAARDQHCFIRFLRLEQNVGRGAIAKVNALTLAHKELVDCEHEFVGNLDADVSFDTTYFERLIQYFDYIPNLGIGGGLIYERRGLEFRGRPSNSIRSVAHAAQLMRRKCYDEIGGYIALKYGGEDWHAEIRARAKGWQVTSFPELKVMHHRPTGGADPVLLHRFREGKMDYSVGSHPAFEMLKCARRVPERPFIAGALSRLAGFLWSCACRDRRLISPEHINYLRKEQLERVKALLGQSN